MKRAAASLLLIFAVVLGLLSPAPVGAWQASRPPEEPVEPLPLTTMASADLTITGGELLVWVVQRDPAPGADVPLRAVLAERDLPRMHGEHGAFRRMAAPARQSRLRLGETVPLGGAAIDALAVGITLLPAARLPADLPAGALLSGPFRSPDQSELRLELRRGILEPGGWAALPESSTPAILLAVDRPLHVASDAGAPITLGRGEMTLLTQRGTLHNAGRQPVTVMLALIAPHQNASALHLQSAPPDGTRAAADPVLDSAWSRFGCSLNPGNPSCLAVGLAAACQHDPRAAGCADDSDGDRCLDTAEVRASLDPFDAADCLGGQDGRPLLNCLFPGAPAACDGSQPMEPATRGALPDPRRAAHPGDAGGRVPPLEVAAVDCGVRERDPTCDGFAPALP